MKRQNKYLGSFQKPIATISILIREQTQFSLRWILLSRILLVIILFFLVSQFITYQTVRSALMETARQNLTESVSRKTETIENSLKATKSNLASVSRDYLLKSGASLNYQTIIDGLQEKLPTQVDCIQLINTTTNEIAASNCGTTSIQTFSTDLWHQEEQELTINNLVKTSYLLPDLASQNNPSTNESQISLALSVPVYVPMHYALTTRWKLPLEQKKISTIVIDEAGTIIAHPNREKVGHNFQEETDISQLKAIIKNALAWDLEDFIHFHRNNQLLISYGTTANPIFTDNNHRWVILAVTPIAETLSDIKEIQQVFLRAIACLVVVSIIVVINLIQTLAAPLEKLTDYAIDLNNTNTIELQQTSQNLKVKEFNKLAEALNKLSKTLNLLVQNLKETNIYGEAKIKFIEKKSQVLRTHLNGVICSVQLVLDDLCDNPEEEIEYLQQCFDGSVKLLAVLEEFFNLLQAEKAEKFRTLEEANISKQSKTQFLPIISEALRTHLNGMIGSIYLVLDDACDNREEEKSNLHQCFDCSLKLLDVLEEFFNLLQQEKAV